MKTSRPLSPRRRVVHAGDPDREGQLLIEEVLVFLGYRGPVQRVLISDLNSPQSAARSCSAPERQVPGPVRSGARAAARRLALRHQPDPPLHGPRAAAATRGPVGGRVQTPVLGLVVRRDLEIANFVPRTVLRGRRSNRRSRSPFLREMASWSRRPRSARFRGPRSQRVSCEQIERKTQGECGSVAKATRDRKADPPPLPFSLSALQIEGGRRLAVSPKAILDVCQSLYETHRLITYPRSDCSYLPEGHMGEARDVAKAIATIEPALSDLVRAADFSLRSRAWSDGKVTAHHAIIPTPRGSISAALTADERAVYDMIARRYLAQFFPPFEYHAVDVVLLVAGEEFVAQGREPLVAGWKSVCDVAPDGAGDAEEDDVDEGNKRAGIPPLSVGQAILVAKARAVERRTKPPRAFTTSTLLQAMVGIARFVSDPQIKQLLRETDGIGTPATQAAIIQTLFDRRYVEQQKRNVVSTSTGRSLIAALPSVATEPDMTALWEAALRRINDGAGSLDHFLEGVRGQLAGLVRQAESAGDLRLPDVPQRRCPAPGCGGSLRLVAGKHGKFWACGRYPECRHTDQERSPPRRGRKRRPGASTRS